VFDIINMDFSDLALFLGHRRYKAGNPDANIKMIFIISSVPTLIE